MKSILTFLAAMAVLTSAAAQQTAQYSLYMLNKFAHNPAYAGLDNSLSMTGAYRKQWAGLEGSPVTQNFNAHLPLYFLGGGAGFNFENETLGSWKQMSATVAYAWQKTMGKGVLSLGLSGGLVQRQLDGSKVRTPGTIFDDQGNPIDLQDAQLTLGKQSGSAPTAHAGAFYQGERFEVGVSAMNLLENDIQLSTFTFSQKRTYNLLLGYRLDVGKNFTVNPSILVKTDARQTQADFSLLARYNENIFAGASFRGWRSESVDALAMVAGLKLSEKITLAYAYDLTLSNLKTVSSGSHEILLNYNLGKPIGKGKPPKIIYNPRSL